MPRGPGVPHGAGEGSHDDDDSCFLNARFPKNARHSSRDRDSSSTSPDVLQPIRFAYRPSKMSLLVRSMEHVEYSRNGYAQGGCAPPQRRASKGCSGESSCREKMISRERKRVPCYRKRHEAHLHPELNHCATRSRPHTWPVHQPS